MIASKKVQFIMLPQVAITRIINRNYTKEVAKKRYSNDKKSFNVPFYKHDTNLSNPQISWKIKEIYKSYNPTLKRCNLCLTEKLEILDEPYKNLLNKRSEIISQCCHENKYRLKTLASNMTLGDVI